MPASESPSGNGSGTAVFLVIAAVLLGVVWAGAQLASLLNGERLTAGLAPTFHALVRLPAYADQPRLAWGPPWEAALPGPELYWACTAFAAVLAGVAVAFGMRLFGRGPVGTADRKRLGVDTKARLATARDLRPLVVKGPTPGRLILGRVQGRLVATELRDPLQKRRRDPRAGDRSAVAVFGPSRCGKSANMISAILENEGPAILSSVKGDLLEATIARRAQLGGEIKVFDPTGIIPGIERAQWSPVAKCGTVTGAKKLAHALASSNTNTLPHDGYFKVMAEELLWPLLFTAVVSGATMGDVVRWVLADEASIPEITARLDPFLAGSDPAKYVHATIAMRVLSSLWEKEPRTRSSIYTTALTMVTNWEDPVVADCSARSDITLEWLVSGRNTLYICSPMHEQLRLATVFGGILDDLLQQAYEWRNDHGSRLPDTLLILDEAANAPARWLPQVASTCSGIGIQLVTIWQSKAQIDDAYGTLADSVLTNHGTKLFFSGISDPSTLDYVSRLLGDEEVIQRGASNDVNFGRRSVNESATRLRLVPADILRQVPPGQGLLIHGTLRPAHLKGRFYYAEKSLRRLAGEDSVAAAAASLAPPPPALSVADDTARSASSTPSTSTGLAITSLGGADADPS
ncbi:MAG: type IV secretory system conjugative DNA transfer family protein [Acidimicrobiales bacterium]